MTKLTHLQHCELNVELVTAEAFAEAAQRETGKSKDACDGERYRIQMEQLEIRLRNALSIIENGRVPYAYTADGTPIFNGG